MTEQHTLRNRIAALVQTENEQGNDCPGCLADAIIADLGLRPVTPQPINTVSRRYITRWINDDE